jgi:hypothetical protein
MNKDYQIYQAPAELIPKEDEARLEGYLKGRAESVELEEARKKFTELINNLEDNK